MFFDGAAAGLITEAAVCAPVSTTLPTVGPNMAPVAAPITAPAGAAGMLLSVSVLVAGFAEGSGNPAKYFKTSSFEWPEVVAALVS